MSIKINDTLYLNYEEQVLKNKQDIEYLLGQLNLNLNETIFETVTPGNYYDLTIVNTDEQSPDYSRVYAGVIDIGVNTGDNRKVKVEVRNAAAIKDYWDGKEFVRIVWKYDDNEKKMYIAFHYKDGDAWKVDAKYYNPYETITNVHLMRIVSENNATVTIVGFRAYTNTVEL